MSAETTGEQPVAPVEGRDDPATDPRTSASLLAATPDGATDEAVEIASAVGRSDAGPSTLATMLVALGGPISDEDDLIALLQRVVDVTHEVVENAACVSITIALGGRTYTAVHTSARALRVDQGQYDAGDGPCLHAARTGETVLVDVDGGEQLWPDFSAAAAEEGVHSFLAAALVAPDQPLGALNLYGTAHAAFDHVDADVLELLTTTVSRAIGDFARFKSALEVADSLRAALSSRAPIEQAKGIIMGEHGVDADQAFQILRAQSQNSNRRVRDLAAELIASKTSPGTALGR